MNTGKVVLGVVAGLAAGALLGVLFAPAKGSDTRKKIAQKTGDAKDAVKGKINEFLDGMAEKFSRRKDNKGHAEEAEVKTAQG